jgi:hypothetical protein
MRPNELRRRLRDAPIPNQHDARERSWRVVRGAYDERAPMSLPARAPKRLALALAAAGVVLAVVLTPAGAKVVDFVRDVVRPSAREARPLTSLPAPGSLLVESANGPWVVQEDGSQRLLGDYRDAEWSPHGYYVAVTNDHQLSAVEPDGTVHWSLNRPHPRDPRWVPQTGYRIAYRTGPSMRVVAGNGVEDHLLDPTVARTAPAWRPVPLARAKATEGNAGANVVAVAQPDGSIETIDADTLTVYWRTPPGPVPTELAWSADASRLVALAGSEVRVFSGGGRLLRRVRLPSQMTATDGAFAPTGKSFAVSATANRDNSRRSVLFTVALGADRPQARPLLADPGTFDALAWSPDGRWLLVAWRDADAWLFLRPEHPGDVETAGQISRQFSPGSAGASAAPRPAGWCCTATGGS